MHLIPKTVIKVYARVVLFNYIDTVNMALNIVSESHVKGAAFGFSAVFEEARAELEPFVNQLVPKLYRLGSTHN